MIVNQKCSRCLTAETKRHDGLCPNCSAIMRPYEPKTQPIEDLRIERMGNRCADCGTSGRYILKLIHNIGACGGTPCPNRVQASIPFCLEASRDPGNFIVRCHNCQSRFYPSAGRPPKYSTFEQRLEATNESKRIHKIIQKRKAIEACGGTCAQCDGPADGIHYIGETGGGPKRSREWVYGQVLREPEYARQFLAYCDPCRPDPYFVRAKRGEVDAPEHWKRA